MEIDIKEKKAPKAVQFKRRKGFFATLCSQWQLMSTLR